MYTDPTTSYEDRLKVSGDRQKLKDSKYKLAWWEEDSKCCTAYGDHYWVDTSSAILHFEGTQGEILLPTRTMKFVIK